MAISAGAQKWREAAQAELSRAGIPLPVDLVLAIIDIESSGSSGAVNPSSGASGLMQVMPITLETYNNYHAVKYTMDDLRNPANPTAQIRVGVWVLGRYWRSAYRYLVGRLPTVDTGDLMKFADLFYSTGPSAIKKLANKLVRPTYQAFVEAYPNHGGLPHSAKLTKKVSDSGAQFSLDDISDWLHQEGVEKIQKTKTGAAIALVILAASWWFLNGGFDGAKKLLDN